MIAVPVASRDAREHTEPLLVSISDSHDYLDGLMKKVERQAIRIANNHGAEIADSFVEYF